MLIVEFTDNEERLYHQTVEWLSTKLSNAPTYLKKGDNGFTLNPYTRICITENGNVITMKVCTMKVGTHKKSVIDLWVVLIPSVSFGVYKNFTVIDQHTMHEVETIQLRLNDTNGIENFVKNFVKSYYTWSNSKEVIEVRTQAIGAYLTRELQDLNVDIVRTDIPTSSTVTDVLIWDVEQSGDPTYEVD